ncbi:ribosomal-protein-alanine N-acetyltransferase [bacterium]|nr:ribosomal-protein-alanine N-acetyltransferase [bacterium]
MSGDDENLRVRPGGPLDLAPVVAIENLSFGDPWSAAALLGELIADQLRLPLVAERGGEVVGFLMAWRVADQLHVLNIAADPRCLRQGIGTALLRDAARRGLAEGLVEVTLEVRRGNAAARAFYRRHGFRESGVRTGYYADTGEDAIILDCALAALAGA